MWYKLVKMTIVIGLLVVLGACKTDSINEDLTGYVKPTIRRINPEGIIYSNMGFILKVFSDGFENDRYTLYLNNRKISSQTPDYWHNQISFEIPVEVLRELANPTNSNDTLIQVRLTPIQEDIGGDFQQYANYVSDVKTLTIKKNNTTFSTPIRLSELWSNSTDPLLRIDGHGHLYLAWREKLNGVFQAFFCFSQDEGRTWSQILNISRSNRNVMDMDLDIDDAGHFYMVWQEEAVNGAEVFFCRSLDNGTNWNFPEKVSNDSGYLGNPRIKVTSTGALFMSCTRSAINYYRRYEKIWVFHSLDQGNSWRSSVLVDDAFLGGVPALQTGEAGDLYLVASINSSLHTYYSPDNGITWQDRQVAFEGYYMDGQSSTLFMDPAEKLNLLWNNEYTSGHVFETWTNFSQGLEKGNRWKERQNIDLICDTAGLKSILWANGNSITLLLSAPNSLFWLRSTDEGATWSYPEFIPGTLNSMGAVPMAMVMADSDRMYIVYVNRTASSGEVGNLYFLRTL